METISIAIICSVAGVFFGACGLARNTKQDIKTDTVTTTRLESKIDYVSKGVDDIRLDMKDQGRKIECMNEKVIRVEESAKQAHKRIDRIDEIIKEGE